MRTISRAFACRKPRRSPDALATWARNLLTDPARFHATEHEAAIVADLLADLEAAR